jgi:D-amino peptidase
VLALLGLGSGAGAISAQDSWSVYISADMEGLAGVGTAAMTNGNGKDYGVGRRMMTAELNAVVRGIRTAADQRGIRNVRIVINDSHGDHANALIEDLAEGVEYVQGSLKPLGMVAELDESFDAAMYIGYHARASTMGFIAHTGSGLVRDMSINGVPSGEGEMNAAFAGAMGVPVVLVAGDEAYVAQARATYASTAESVVTKSAVTAQSAHLRPVAEVHEELTQRAHDAMMNLSGREPWIVSFPWTVEMSVESTTHADVAEGIPGVERVDPNTVRFRSGDPRDAYRLIRILYRFLSV